ncbi:MAG: rhodanese-like domain-containing protein [Alphaproteobacteria bacterium]
MNHNSAFLKLVDDAKTRIKEISAEEVMANIHKSLPFLLIDTREESEFAAGRITGAVHLSKGIIECYIESKVPDKATPMVLYCGGGYRSALAADSLQKMGYTNVLSMAGGWRGWNERGFPTSN